MLRKALPFFAAAAALAGLTAAASAQKQTLRMAYWAGPAHHMVQTQEAWIKTIEEASGGNLTVVVDKSALAKPSGQYDLIKNGVRDLVWHIPAYTRGRFDMITAGEIPFLCPNATVCSPALWKWYNKHGLADREFTDTKLLVTFVHGPGAIHTVRPVKTLEEIKGVKIRAGGAGVPISQALGMSAVAAPATQAHEMLSRGTVEGVLFPFEALDSFRLGDVIKAHLEVPGGFYTATFVIVMNKDAYAKLTPENQKALMKASGEAGSQVFGQGWDAADARARKGAEKRGDTFQTVAPGELEKWRPLLKFVRDDWIKKAKDRGLDGEMLLKDFEAIIKTSG